MYSGIKIYDSFWDGFRFESVSVEELSKKESGYLFSSNISHSFGHQINLNFAISFNDTDSYSSRIYLYERDLPGILRNVAVYNRDMRFMALATKEISTYFSTSLKFERLTRDNVLNKVVDSRIGLQFDIKY